MFQISEPKRVESETQVERDGKTQEWCEKGANHVQIYGMDVEMIDCYKIPSWTAYGGNPCVCHCCNSLETKT